MIILFIYIRLQEDLNEKSKFSIEDQVNKKTQNYNKIKKNK